MPESKRPDVIIVGAGAVGLLLGNLLGAQGISVLILEKEGETHSGSRAIGISPPSLEILKTIGLDEKFIRAGVKVRQAFIHGSRRLLGKVVFDALPSAYPFMLSLPQSQAEKLLENNLRQYSSITLLRNQAAMAIQTQPGQVQVKAGSREGQGTATYTADFVCACDGKKSTIREQMKISFRGASYSHTFLMADFHDQSGFGQDAHLFFTHLGPVESFPLPEKKRRWIITTPVFMAQPKPGYLESEIWQRAGIRLDAVHKLSETPFGVQHYQAAPLYRHRVILCGDAAHVMSPIGGQGMNTGFGDAEFCAQVLARMLKGRERSGAYLRKYQRYRRRAAVVAGRRAALGMRIGTGQGKGLSMLRNLAIGFFLRVWKTKIPIHFSMLNIPYHNLAWVRKKDKTFMNEPG